jgi:hypothetical protein
VAANAPCHSKNYLDPKVVAHYKTAVREMKRQGIKPKVTSLFRSSEYQAQLHKCSNTASCRRAHPGLYYALPPGKSMHEAGFAVDISGVAAGPRGNKHLTPEGKRIVAVMRKHGFNWRYRLADPAHFEADPRKHGYRTAKQAIAHTQSTCDVKLAKLVKRAPQKKTAAKASVTRSNTAKTQLSTQRPETRSTRRTAKASA